MKVLRLGKEALLNEVEEAPQISKTSERGGLATMDGCRVGLKWENLHLRRSGGPTSPQPHNPMFELGPSGEHFGGEWDG
jgi:hypothetical protein